MLERWFKLSERGTNARTELIAGLTTFLTAGYIVFVNPNILSATGMDKGALITVTCIVAGVSSILMGLWANAPIMMAPGMGLNAFFAFSLVLGSGGTISWQEALGVVFISGVVFLILTFLGIRERIVKAIPPSIRIATSVGIGLFIAFIGMQGLGLIVKNDATLVGLGTLSRTVLLGLVGLIQSSFWRSGRSRDPSSSESWQRPWWAWFPGFPPFPRELSQPRRAFFPSLLNWISWEPFRFHCGQAFSLSCL